MVQPGEDKKLARDGHDGRIVGEQHRDPVSEQDQATHRDDRESEPQMTRTGGGEPYALPVFATVGMTDQDGSRRRNADLHHVGHRADRQYDLVCGQFRRADPAHHDRRQGESHHFQHDLHRNGQSDRQQSADVSPRLDGTGKEGEIAAHRLVPQEVGQHEQRHTDP